MKTVKEVSELTGISVRTLHYYDEIGLLVPSGRSEAQYRLYDEAALEKLQQILFFREFDIPLKEIRAVMDSPAFDKTQILRAQRQMLTAKKERLERLIASMDQILKGEKKMDFEVFSQSEIEGMYTAMAANMDEEQKRLFAGLYGSLDGFHEHFVKSASTEEAQKKFRKVVEWYGGQDAENPEAQIFEAYRRRLEAVLEKLAAKKGCDVTSFEVKEIVGEYDFVSRQIYQMKDVSAMMLELAAQYRGNEKLQREQDAAYGEGTAEFFGRAIEAFYKK